MIWWQRAFQSLQGEAEVAPAGPVLRGVAAVLARLYEAGSRGRRALYDAGWLTARRLPAPVVSIGNLVVGGTGKTPFTHYLAQRYQRAGCRVVILSRGYGGRARGVQIVGDGRQVLLRPPVAGDEACLLATKLPGIPVVTGPDRYRAGHLAWEAFRPDLFLLDDGFQHVQLHRDLDVVLVDAAQPFGNGRLLPRGPLREPVSTLQRPLVLVLTRYAQRYQQTWRELQAAFPAAVVLRAVFRTSQARRQPQGQPVAWQELAHSRLAALAGLARPHAFLAGLKEAGLDIQQLFAFPDHHTYTAGDVAEVLAAASRSGVEGLITTEKDWLRLAGVWTAVLPLYVVGLQVELLDQWPDHLLPLVCQGEEGLR